MGAHLIGDEFQPDKYPTTPRGKVPLSTKDTTAQDLLWEYAQRRRSVDTEFSDDLETALVAAGYVPKPHADVEERAGMPCPDCGQKQKRWDIQRQTDGSLAVRLAYLIPAEKIAKEIKALCSLLRKFIG